LATPAQAAFVGAEVFRWQIIETGIVLKGFTSADKIDLLQLLIFV